MTQELQVLKCFSCETFQSHIVKKTNKWECKICGIKQSIKKVYGRGSGKDCRLHTQKLNALRGEKDERKNQINYEEEEKPHQFEQNTLLRKTNSELPKKNDQSSKWSAYLDEDNKSSTLTTDTNSLKKKNRLEFTAKKRKRQPETIDFDILKASGNCSNMSYDAKGNNSSISCINEAIKIKKGQYVENIPSFLSDDDNFGLLNNCTTNKSSVKKNQIDNNNFSSSLSLKWSKYLDPGHNFKDDSADIFSSNYTINSGCSQGDLSDNNSALSICLAVEPNTTKTTNIPNPSCNSYFATSKTQHDSTYRSEAKIEQLKVSLSHSDNNPENVSENRMTEEIEPSKMPSLPVFEQDCNFKDCDFVLDF